jgi:hypothetical protein
MCAGETMQRYYMHPPVSTPAVRRNRATLPHIKRMIPEPFSLLGQSARSRGRLGVPSRVWEGIPEKMLGESCSIASLA